MFVCFFFETADWETFRYISEQEVKKIAIK